MKRTLEICCSDADSVLAAAKGGADRIELCSALSEGGLTPSIGLIEYAASQEAITVNVLIRPRSGDFIYNQEETDIMVHDISAAAKTGASGVVIGALTPDGDIDISVCRRLVDTAKKYNLSVTFHRAFDVCRNPEKAFSEIIALGCDRLLTSGQMPSALEGAKLIETLNRIGKDKIKIMAGAGVTPSNVAEIINATGIYEIHASAKTSIGSAMRFRNESVSMGSPEKDEYSRVTTSIGTVRQLAQIIHQS